MNHTTSNLVEDYLDTFLGHMELVKLTSAQPYGQLKATKIVILLSQATKASLASLGRL